MSGQTTGPHRGGSRPRGSSPLAAALSALAAMAVLVVAVVLALEFGPRSSGPSPGPRMPDPEADPPVSEQGYSAPFFGRVTSEFGPREGPLRGESLPPGVDRQALRDHAGVDLGASPRVPRSARSPTGA